MIPNSNMQNRGPQNFMQQGPMNNATSGGQAYNFMSGGRPTQQQPYMHPATRPPQGQRIIAERDEASSVENSLGLKKGVLAPNLFETEAISSQSVETI